MSTAFRKSISLAVKGVDRTRREFKFIASRQEVDRDGEVVVTRGIQTANFDKNPIMLVDHDRGRVFGRVHRKWIETVDGADALLMVATALPVSVSADADQIYGEIVAGARSALSISFLVLEVDPRPILPNQTGNTFSKVELLEVSSVSLPSCASAVVIDKAAGDRSPLIRLPNLDPARPIGDLEKVVVMRQTIREAVGVALAQRVAETVRRRIGAARGNVDYILVSDRPSEGAARALRHHVGNDPALRVAGMSDREIQRHAAEIAKTALADAITAAVSTAIRRARGRVD